MADDQPPRQEGSPPDAGQGWTALSYLIGGMAVWGFAGWLIDRWLGLDGIAAAVGIIVGMAGGVYLVVARLGRS